MVPSASRIMHVVMKVEMSLNVTETMKMNLNATETMEITSNMMMCIISLTLNILVAYQRTIFIVISVYISLHIYLSIYAYLVVLREASNRRLFLYSCSAAKGFMIYIIYDLCSELCLQRVTLLTMLQKPFTRYALS